MDQLSTFAGARPEHRIQYPNSTPREIGIFGLGAGGRDLVARAMAEGVAVTMLDADALGEGRPAALPGLNALVVVGRPGEADGAAAANIYQWARQIGVLVTAVVVAPERGALDRGAGVQAMRQNADLVTLTTDEDYLSVMLQWLGSTR